jgi:hypothetical protein
MLPRVPYSAELVEDQTDLDLGHPHRTLSQCIQFLLPLARMRRTPEQLTKNQMALTQSCLAQLIRIPAVLMPTQVTLTQVLLTLTLILLTLIQMILSGQYCSDQLRADISGSRWT